MIDLKDPNVIGPLVGVLVLVAVMGLRLARANTARPLKLEYLWIMPAVLLAMTGLLIWQMPPQGLEWLWLAVAFAIGGAIGWQRGRMMAISIDPETHALSQTQSRAAVLFLLAIVAVRFGLREVLTGEASALHLSLAFVTDVFVVFAVGLLGVTRLELFIRARRLLTEARAAKAAS
ncbi:MAG: CcdC protein domain-containing protein [Caulobacter sp.]